MRRLKQSIPILTLSGGALLLMGCPADAAYRSPSARNAEQGGAFFIQEDDAGHGPVEEAESDSSDDGGTPDPSA